MHTETPKSDQSLWEEWEQWNVTFAVALVQHNGVSIFADHSKQKPPESPHQKESRAASVTTIRI